MPTALESLTFKTYQCQPKAADNNVRNFRFIQSYTVNVIHNRYETAKIIRKVQNFAYIMRLEDIFSKCSVLRLVYW